jgi:hypothetical protein
MTATTGDRDHTYDRLTRRLGSRSGSTAVMLALGVVAAVVGLAVTKAPVAAGLVTMLAAFAGAILLDTRLLPLVPKREGR